MLSCNQQQEANEQQSLQQNIQPAQTISLAISGMDCDGCVKSVTDAIRSIEGVEDVVVSLDKGTANIKGSKLELNNIFLAIDDAGYGATLLDTTLVTTPADSSTQQ